MTVPVNSRLWMVCNALGQQMQAVINTAGITNPGAGFQGFPNYEDLTKIMQQGNQYVISVYPDEKGVKNTSRFFPSWMLARAPNVTITASVNGNVITFGGQPQGNINIHCGVGVPLRDAYYQTTTTDTLNTIATNVAGAINALGLAGITATPSAATVSVSTSTTVECTVGGSGLLSREARRESRLIQVTVWTPNAVLRDNVYVALEGQIGMDDEPFIALPDGTNFWCRWMDDVLSDERQRDFAMYTAHIFFMCEYGVLRTVAATQIGSITQRYTLNGQAGPTITED